MNKGTWTIIIYCILLAAFCVWGFGKQQNLGDSGSDFKIVCIRGHQYYKASFAAKGLLGIRLNEDGKPVQCEGD